MQGFEQSPPQASRWNLVPASRPSAEWRGLPFAVWPLPMSTCQPRQQKQGNFIVPALQPQRQRLVAKCKLVANLWQKASRHRSFGENQNGGQATAATPYLNPLWWPVFERGFHAERRSLLTGAAMWGSSSTDPCPFPDSVWAKGSFDSEGLLYIFTSYTLSSSHLHILASSHSLSLSISLSLSLSFLFSILFFLFLFRPQAVSDMGSAVSG